MNIYREKKVLIILVISICCNSLAVYAQTLHVNGVVRTESGDPLPWVNIGVKNKNVGVTTAEDGSFRLKMPAEFQADPLLFSRVGYEDVIVPVYDVIRNGGKMILKEKVTSLKEVVVSLEKPRKITLGTKGFTPLTWVSVSTKQGVYAEHAKVIHIKKASRLLNANVRVGGNKKSRDSITYRFNIYQIKDGLPAERLLEKNIIKTFPRAADMLTFDLTAENIYLEQDCVVSFEFIPKKVKNSKPISFRANVVASDAFVRNTSVGSWKKMENGSSCMFVEVQQ